MNNIYKNIFNENITLKKLLLKFRGNFFKIISQI